MAGESADGTVLRLPATGPDVCVLVACMVDFGPIILHIPFAEAKVVEDDTWPRFERRDFVEVGIMDDCSSLGRGDARSDVSRGGCRVVHKIR